MSHRIVRYERAEDGEERWAIWSTVVDDFIWYDMTESELVEFQADKARRKALHKTARRVRNLRAGDNPYYGGLPTEEKMEELRHA